MNHPQRGALHIVGLVILVLIVGGVYLLAGAGREVRELRSEVGALNQRVHALELKVAALQGKVGP